MKKETGQAIRELAYYSSLGFQIALAIFLGLAFGLWLDRIFGTRPVLMFVFLGLGIAAGFKNLWLAMKKTMRDDKK